MFPSPTVFLVYNVILSSKLLLMFATDEIVHKSGRKEAEMVVVGLIQTAVEAKICLQEQQSQLIIVIVLLLFVFD